MIMTILMKKIEANVSYNLIVFATSLQTLITEPCILTEKAMVLFKRGEPFVNKFCILFGGVAMEIFSSLNLPDHHAPC